MNQQTLDSQRLRDFDVPFQNLKHELSVVKQKLDSKVEALLILSKQLDSCQSERDQFKLMAEQLRDRYTNLKKQLRESHELVQNQIQKKSRLCETDESLVQLLCETREHNKSLQLELNDLKHKLREAQGDVKLLREQIARQRVGTTDEGVNTRHFPAHERESLVKQLEASGEQFVMLERDLQTVLDEKEELVTERDAYKHKVERLNKELNYVLTGDDKRIVDIDSLSMENAYLKERSKQLEQEKTIAVSTVSKYKATFEKRKKGGILKLGSSRPNAVIVSQKQVQQLLKESQNAELVNAEATVADLRALAVALYEANNDKNVALSHQKKTNKILGERVTELERKLKNIETSEVYTNWLQEQRLEFWENSYELPSQKPTSDTQFGSSTIASSPLLPDELEKDDTFDDSTIGSLHDNSEDASEIANDDDHFDTNLIDGEAENSLKTNEVQSPVSISSDFSVKIRCKGSNDNICDDNDLPISNFCTEDENLEDLNQAMIIGHLSSEMQDLCKTET